MREEPEFRLWTEGAWRCEYWVVAHKGELRLYRHDDIERSHQVSGGEAALAVSQQWRDLILSGSR